MTPKTRPQETIRDLAGRRGSFSDLLGREIVKHNGTIITAAVLSIVNRHEQKACQSRADTEYRREGAHERQHRSTRGHAMVNTGKDECAREAERDAHSRMTGQSQQRPRLEENLIGPF